MLHLKISTGFFPFRRNLSRAYLLTTEFVTRRFVDYSTHFLLLLNTKLVAKNQSFKRAKLGDTIKLSTQRIFRKLS